MSEETEKEIEGLKKQIQTLKAEAVAKGKEQDELYNHASILEKEISILKGELYQCVKCGQFNKTKPGRYEMIDTEMVERELCYHCYHKYKTKHLENLLSENNVILANSVSYNMSTSDYRTFHFVLVFPKFRLEVGLGGQDDLRIEVEEKEEVENE